MMQATLAVVLIWCCLSGQVVAQSPASDVLLLKKGSKTIERFYSGAQIGFYTTEGMWVQGAIDSIRRDSLYITNYHVRMIGRPDGSQVLDTSGRFPMYWSLNNVGSFPAGHMRGQNIFTDGRLLMLGGAGYLGVNLFNTIRIGEAPFSRDNRPQLLAAATVATTGYFLSRAWPARWVLGRKYRLQVLSSAGAASP